MLDSHLIAQTRPLAKEENVVLWRDYRVTVLQNRLFRLEKSKEKRFRDEATQSVWFRDMPPQAFTVTAADIRLLPLITLMRLKRLFLYTRHH